MQGEGCQAAALRRGVNLLPCAAVAIVFALCISQRAAAQAPGSEAKVAIVPYVWVPSISGTLKYGTPSGSSGQPTVDVGTNYTANLNFAFMIAGEARKGRWSVYTDFVYASVSAEGGKIKSIDFGGSVVNTSLTSGVETSVQGEIFTLAGGYQLFRHPTLTIDGTAGLRYFGLQTDASWQLSANVSGPSAGQTFPASGSVSKNANLFDAVFGVRGRFIEPNTPWSFPYLLDIGTGSSALTWQAMAGVSYAFKWGEIALFYRHLYFDQSGDQFVQNFSFSGPGLGAIFRF